MKKIFQHLIPVVWMLVATSSAWSQSSPNCATASDDNYLTGKAFFNYGSVSNSFNTKNRANVTIGQSVVGTYFGQNNKGSYGFWARFLLPPNAPSVAASEGDLEDRVQVDWSPDPLSPAATGYKLYRNNSLLASVDGETFSFLDFNVIAGKFYTYEVSAINGFGEGPRGSALGFLNPNGVVTGQIKSVGGNPVEGAVVTLTPTLGRSVAFNGNSMAFAEYNEAYPRDEFTVSCWVKIGTGNDGSAIFDLGSNLSKNWWLHTLPAADGKGVRFGIGNGAGNTTELDFAFPLAEADAWHNIAVTFNGVSLLLYADGELVSTASAAVESDSTTLFFGQKPGGTGKFTGLLDEVRFFDRQMSQTEIQMFINRTVDPEAVGLVNYWKFDEGVGSKTFDLSPTKQKLYFCGATFTSDRPLVVNAGISNETGFYRIPGINYGAGTTFAATPSKNFYFNQSLEFNGVNGQYATLTDFDLSDSSTIEITAKAFDLVSEQCLLSKDGHFSLNLNAGNLVLEMASGPHDFGPMEMGFHRLAFVMVQNGGSVAVTFYKNGTLVGSHTFTGVAEDFSGGIPWTLGKNAGGHFFTGLIDEVAVFNAALPLSDLQAAANIGTNPTHNNLVNYFPLNEGSGTELKDYGLALTGTGMTNGATFSTVAGITMVSPHEFTPSTRLVTLTPSNTSVDQIDFSDQSTIPVSGYVRFIGTDCFQEQVEILVNGNHATPLCFTDSTGYFSLDLEPGASAILSPTFKTHTYYPAFWEINNIASPVSGVLFRNQIQRSIEGQLAGNNECRKSIIPTDAAGNPLAIVKVKVETLDGCFYEEQQIMEANGKFKFDNLPPLPFTIAVTEHSNNEIYNYFQLQGGSTVDLTDVNDTTDFIYYSQPEIEMSPLDTNACGEPMLEQDGKYQVDIKVFQAYDGGLCYLDTAELTIDNLIEGEGPLDTLMTGGKFKYKFQAGFPNIIPPFTKTISILAKANEQENTLSTTAVVLGKRPRLVNFTSTSPQIPLIILRDPPGDGSSATIEQGQTICNGWSIGASASVKASLGLELDLGNKQQIIAGTPATGTITEIGFENNLEFGASVKTSASVNKSVEFCMTTNEKYSTSSGDVLLGEDADVFVGGALNLLFGITDDLKWDTASCTFRIDTGLLVFPDNFATTFLYSGYQIKKVIIPNLLLVGDTTSAQQWENILQYNRDLKAASVFEKNISFDAGVTYENSTSTQITDQFTWGLEVEIDATYAQSIGFDISGTGSKVKLGVELSTGVKTEFSTTQTSTQAVSYTLSDDDIKDVFTVNILQDKVYGTPVFNTISGNSACPYEENTVPRDGVDLTVDRTVVANVDENGAAVFTFTIGNTSQTDEWRFYTFQLFNESNPNGAEVRIQGTSGSSAGFLIAPGGSQEVIVTVERGPVEYDYEDLLFHVFSQCESDHYDALGNGDFPPEPFYKAIFADVHFLEPCSPIDIGFPLENWVWQLADGQFMFITLNDFNRYDDDLELIRVQYRRKQGDGAWINITEVPKSDLDNDVFEIVQWNTAALQDGEYEIRAVTQCFGGENAGISHIISGRFERESPNILGTPEPADGVLSPQDEISVTFNEPIRCDLLIQADFFDNNNIGLYNTRTGDLVDAQMSCSVDKIILVPNVPNQFIENEILRVEVDNIKDLAGNTFIHTDWEFFVDRNSLRWLGPNIEEVVTEGNALTVTREMENISGAAVGYNITGIPIWAEVIPSQGILPPGATQVVTFKFAESLPLGDYLDTIKLETALGDEPLVLDVRVMCEGPQWEVDPAAWTYSMNLTVELDIQGEISEDRMDLVGAFINGQLRGMAYLEYVPGVDRYEAFLTVYSNDFIDGTVTFQIWDATACLLYGEVLESFPFASDEIYGTPTDPVTLHTNGLILRKIPLRQGWNWISFNLGFPDASLDAALASLDHPQNDLMKSQTTFASYSGAPVNGWIGSLTTLGNTSMYQYRADVTDTISMLGNPIDLLTTSIPIVAGWNWIGYLPQSALPVNEALASLTALNGDVIKSQSAFAQYVAGFGWLGNLDYMQAPEGYLLKMASPGTLSYPDNFTGGGGQSLQSRNGGIVNQSPWTVDPASFEHTMIMVGMLAADGNNITAEGQTLGVFANGEVRGVAPAIYVEQLGEWMFFLTAYANGSGEPLQFKLHDAATGEISDLQEQLLFNIDGQEGTVEAPKPFTLPGALAATEATDFGNRLLIQPNPFGSSTTIRFRSAKADEAIVTMTDAVGRVVKEATPDVLAGWNQLTWEVPGLPAGVYIIKVETGGVSMASKVVVK